MKVVYVLSLIFKSLEYEWIVRYLDKEKVQVSFILLNPASCELQEWLEREGVKTYHVPFYGKKSYPRCLYSVYRILKQEKPGFVNCNLLDANLIGLSAAWIAGVPNRIYTRHHSTFHHVYFRKGRYYDYLANALATKIVAVSSLVRKVLVEYEGVPEAKILLIPHGFGISDFENVDVARVKRLVTKYSIEDKGPVVGAISRYIEWKGVQFLIPAFRQVLKKFPDAVLLIANARQGTFTRQIAEYLKDLPADSYREIEFESDIIAFYKLLDAFVHLPIDGHSEAFGRIYPEALASGVPLVCTISGIAHDIIRDNDNALVVPHQDANSTAHSIIRILNDRDLAARLSANAKKEAKNSMNMERQKQLLEQLYSDESV